MFKKIFCSILCVATLFCLCGCDKTVSEDFSTPPINQTTKELSKYYETYFSTKESELSQKSYDIKADDLEVESVFSALDDKLFSIKTSSYYIAVFSHHEKGDFVCVETPTTTRQWYKVIDETVFDSVRNKVKIENNTKEFKKVEYIKTENNYDFVNVVKKDNSVIEYQIYNENYSVFKATQNSNSAMFYGLGTPFVAVNGEIIDISKNEVLEIINAFDIPKTIYVF